MSKLVNVVPTTIFPTEMDEINAQMDCHIQMTDALRDLQRIIKRSHQPKAEKTRLLGQIEHIYHHLRTPVDTMLQEIKGRCN